MDTVPPKIAVISYPRKTVNNLSLNGWEALALHN